MAKRQRDRDRNSGLLDEVITIRFHTKVTKGGRNLSCAALVAVGDGNGKVGLGYGKAKGVPMAIEKASKEARNSMIRVNLVGDTIGHRIEGRHKAARVLLKPAPPGTGVKAGGTVRSIMQVLGVNNVLSKVFGPTNPVNVAQATMQALGEMSSVEEIERLRGVKITLDHPQAKAEAEAAAPAVEEEAEESAVEETEAEETAPEDIASEETEGAAPAEVQEETEAEAPADDSEEPAADEQDNEDAADDEATQDEVDEETVEDES